MQSKRSTGSSHSVMRCSYTNKEMQKKRGRRASFLLIVFFFFLLTYSITSLAKTLYAKVPLEFGLRWLIGIPFNWHSDNDIVLGMGVPNTFPLNRSFASVRISVDNLERESYIVNRIPRISSLGLIPC